MPARSKRRSTNDRVYTSVSTPEQIHFKPQSRTISSLKSSGPSKSTRQQTLTQIDFVTKGTKRIPVEQDIPMEFEELDEAPRRKRRKTHQEASSIKRVTRASAGKAKAGDFQREGISEQQVAGTAFKVEAPITPRKARPLEIPSSQSPPDTPFSAKSTKSFKSPVRSPLKDKSTNPRLAPRHPLRPNFGNDWHQKLKVESTMSWERDDTENSSLSNGSEGSAPQKKLSFTSQPETFFDTEDPALNEQTPMQAVAEPDLSNIDVTNQDIASPAQIKSQIADSDDEDDEDYDVESQPGLAQSEQRAKSLDLGHDPAPSKETCESPPSSRHTVVTLPLNPDLNEPEENTEFNPGQDTQCLLSSINLSPDQDGSLPICPLDLTTINQANPTPHKTATPPPPSSPQNPRSESEELCAQLSNDIMQYTQAQPFQFSLGPPLSNPSSPQQSPSQLSPRHFNPPSSISHDSYKAISSPDTNNNSTTSQPPLQIHPSQATTVDITQPSHLQTTQQLLSSSPHSSPLPTTPTHLNPTSQRQENDEGGGEGKEDLEHELLTMSQLLPESLMRDSLPLPPPWSQESFDEL